MAGNYESFVVSRPVYMGVVRSCGALLFYVRFERGVTA